MCPPFNRVLGSIKRSVGAANSNVFSILYKSLVRPFLEYVAPAWCPNLPKDIRAFPSYLQGKSPGNEVELLKWPTLSDRSIYLS